MSRYSKKRIRALLRESDTASTADKKGEKLEELARYLFEKVSGISFYGRNILDGNRAHELDVVFWNPSNLSEIGFLDLVLIIECKNTGNPVSSADVGWFIRKLQDRGANYAILIALSGITGAASGVDNAHSEILSALVRDKIKVLVVTRQEILDLNDTADLVELLKKKILTLTLYKTVA
jgi:hypothetical protein